MPELTIGQSALLTDMALCVNRYRLLTTGIYVCVHVPVVLDEQTKVVPGLISMTNYGCMKQCEALADGFHGPPNFVLDVFTPGDLSEYERRKKLFEQFGVMEYVVLEDTPAPTLHWNRLESGDFQTVEPDANGVIKSKALPGLWIPTQALAARNWWMILAAIERGCTRLGHHEHQETIWHKNDRRADDEAIPFEAG